MRASRSATSTRTQDKTWAQLVDHALSHFVEPRPDRADDPLRLPRRAVAVRAAERRSDGDRRAVRVLRRRDGARQRLQRDQRLRGAGRALRDAGGRGCGRQRRGRAGRPGLRRGALVRHAADGRPRDGDRPARDGARSARTRSATSSSSRLCASAADTAAPRRRIAPSGSPTACDTKSRSPGYHVRARKAQPVRIRRLGGREASTCSRDSQSELARSWFSRRTRRGR